MCQNLVDQCYRNILIPLSMLAATRNANSRQTSTCPTYTNNRLMYTIIYIYIYTYRPDSSVGIATRYGLDGPGIESRLGQDFPQPSSPALGPTQPPIQWVPGLSGRVKRPGRGVDHPRHLAARLKKEYSYTSTPSLSIRGLF